jgi:hypothetical protein
MSDTQRERERWSCKNKQWGEEKNWGLDGVGLLACLGDGRRLAKNIEK